MSAPKDVNEELESDQPRWCSKCERWDDECRCVDSEEFNRLPSVSAHNPATEKGVGGDLSLDKVEATTQWFDEFSARGNNAGGEDVCLPALSPAPLQLDYPAWRMSFSAYGEHLGLEVPA